MVGKKGKRDALEYLVLLLALSNQGVRPQFVARGNATDANFSPCFSCTMLQP